MKKLTMASMLAMSAVAFQVSAGEDPLTKIVPPANEWGLNGAPDYIVEVPPTSIPATGVLDYINTNIELPFDEDKWVKSVQFIPGDRRVLHHLLSYVVASDHTEEFDEADNDARSEFLEGYAPGKEAPTTFPDNMGVLIPDGSALRMSIHYTTMGTESLDATRVGLWFADEDNLPEHEFRTYSVSPGNRNQNIYIPPGAMNHEMAASTVFDHDIELHGFRAHMHYRGKSMRAAVIYPDNTREEIINVPTYSYAWQPTYRMPEPMVIPAGSRIVIEGVMDNSEYNPGVPDPSVPAVGGLQTWEEMFIGYLSYRDL